MMPRSEIWNLENLDLSQLDAEFHGVVRIR